VPSRVESKRLASRAQGRAKTILIHRYAEEYRALYRAALAELTAEFVAEHIPEVPPEVVAPEPYRPRFRPPVRRRAGITTWPKRPEGQAS
jgi:hypothetical protein